MWKKTIKRISNYLQKNNSLTPVATHGNADTDKLKICLDNKGKSGIYCISNLINGKKYVGSSVDLQRRFKQYLNIKHLEICKYMPICRALLKYGYPNFKFEILKYCSPAQRIKWEQFYLDLLKPSYNILQIAVGSTCRWGQNGAWKVVLKWGLENAVRKLKLRCQLLKKVKVIRYLAKIILRKLGLRCQVLIKWGAKLFSVLKTLGLR